MVLKRSELYSSLWSSYDELRGGMDASQYKDYVLVCFPFRIHSATFGSPPSAKNELPQGLLGGNAETNGSFVLWRSNLFRI